MARHLHRSISTARLAVDALHLRGAILPSLAWVDVNTYLNEMAIPQADRIFAPRVLGPEPGMFEAKFVYDAQLKLVSWVEY